MPAWLASALALLRSATIGGPGRALVTGAAAGQAFSGPLEEGAAAAFGGFPFGPRPTRRRRRRALTASDRADIAFIVGMLGPKAGKDFSIVIASRSR